MEPQAKPLYSDIVRRNNSAVEADDSEDIRNSVLDDNHALSTLEALPRELRWRIVEYASECVHFLRLVSRLLQSSVDRLANHKVIIPLVEEVAVSDVTREGPPVTLCITMHVHKSKVALLELRLRLKKKLIRHNNLLTAIEKSSLHQFRVGFCTYWVNYMPHFHEENALKLLGECMGSGITKVEIRDPQMLNTSVFNVFSTITIRNAELSVNKRNILENDANYVIEIAKTLDFEQFTLTVTGITMSKPEKLMFELSKRVRNLTINQLPVVGFPENICYFFGKQNFDWTPVFITMFKPQFRARNDDEDKDQTHKLQSLHIRNFAYPDYLSRLKAIAMKESFASTGHNVCYGKGQLSISERDTLKKVSRSMKAIVDAFTEQHHSMQLVAELTIAPGMNILSISMEVPRNLANLFELRLKKFKFPIEMLARTELSKDHPSGKKLSEVTSVTLYEFDFHKKHDSTVLYLLRMSVGNFVGEVIMDECEDEPSMIVVTNFLDGVKFKKLHLNIGKMTKDAVNFLLNWIPANNVDKLSLHVYRFSKAVEPADLLLKLSTLVHSLYVWQESDWRISEDSMYFFGLYNAKWADIILEMFSNKLDKLSLNNCTYSAYLTLANAGTLKNSTQYGSLYLHFTHSFDRYNDKRRLPLLNKKVWFTTTCDAYTNKFSYLDNYHVVQSHNPGMVDACLRVIHMSREDEEEY